MPFITEEIWQSLPRYEGSVMVSQWPEAMDNEIDEDAEEKMNLIMGVIGGIRNIRGEMNVNPSQKVDVIISLRNEDMSKILADSLQHIKRLANASEIQVCVGLEDKPDKAATAVTTGAEIYIPLEGIIDIEVELNRLEKELTELRKEMELTSKKLSNKDFLNKAPDHIVEKERKKESEFKEKEAALKERLKFLK